jgi:ABC-type multidrug transport system fused ATPase/permease subunit
MTKKSKIPLRLVVISFILKAILGVLLVVECIYFGKVIDAAKTSMESVMSAIVTILVITFLEYLCIIFSRYTVTRGAELGMFNLRQSISKKICHLKFKVFDEASTGDILSRTMSDLNGIGTFWVNTFMDAYTNFFCFTGGLCVCMYISWQLTLVGFFFIPIVSFLVYKSSSIVEKASYESKKLSGKMNAIAHNILSSMMTLKAFTLEDFMAAKFRGVSKDYVKAEKKVGIASAKVYAIGSLIQYVPNGAVIIFAGIMCINNKLTAGEYLAFTFTFNFVSGVLYDCQKYIISLRSSEAMAKRLSVIYKYEEEKEFDVKKPEASSSKVISISDLSFSYKEDNYILKNIDLEIERRQTVAFVGASGCGKSTLIKIISGMYDVPSGKVTIGSFKLCSENIPSIRNQIAIVSQIAYLFPGTILENVRYGKPNATEEEVFEACRKADIHDFIMEQPDKYATVVGEKGIYMSGGQRQRLAIARAFLKDAEILILDEPTSALDSETEKNIQRTLDKLMVGKTAIIVAHRLSTIRNADVIHVFDGGRIVESGTHEELVNKKGCYYDLYQRQFEESQEEIA